MIIYTVFHIRRRDLITLRTMDWAVVKVASPLARHPHGWPAYPSKINSINRRADHFLSH